MTRPWRATPLPFCMFLVIVQSSAFHTKPSLRLAVLHEAVWSHSNDFPEVKERQKNLVNSARHAAHVYAKDNLDPTDFRRLNSSHLYAKFRREAFKDVESVKILKKVLSDIQDLSKASIEGLDEISRKEVNKILQTLKEWGVPFSFTPLLTFGPDPS